MSRRRWTLVASLALLAVAAALTATAGWFVHPKKQCISGAQCQRNLEVLTDAVYMYCNTRWMLPPTLKAALDEAMAAGPGVFSHCQDTPGLGDADYTYVDWSRVARPPAVWYQEYPLLFDARDDYHDQPGVFIFFTNRNVIWDPEVKWLKRFAAEHPEAAIQLPVHGEKRPK
jgi:hypothetical protein